MTTIVTRAGKGLPLTHNEVDANFNNLNTDKYQAGDSPSFGNITVTGTVDGRDVSSDGSKLDGIEAGATADQTAAEIKTAYESNANTNAYTDAEVSKLAGIEANADVTDAGNVNPLVDAHLNTSTAISGEFLSWNGTDYDWASVSAGYTNSDVDTHLNTSTATTGQFLSWNGTDYAWTTSSSGAGYFQGENGNTGDTLNGKGDIFRTHESTLNTNVTIASGDNSLAAGPLTVASGVTLTVSGNLSIV